MLGNDDFASALLYASKRLGCLLDVATSLGVQPTQVYQWIAGVNQPLPGQQARLLQRLSDVELIHAE